ncbi:MAG TPA: DUF1028 domain-containing protein [Candidatus Angelobacter sp.]|nr:DUF1028 domain-containing protein [Candidatus Angelobacter sp.]
MPDRRIFLLFLFALAGILVAQDKPLRPVHTFSIVAFDPATGEMGVAVQSHWFAVGGEVPWAEAGVGAVATQSFIDPSYGPLGLNLMRAGKSAPDALRGLLMADEACNVRQVAMVDTHGQVATFTGAKDIQPAGGIAGSSNGNATTVQCGGQPGGSIMTGKNYAVQANLMSNDRIWPSMSKAFESTRGDLADRMLAALDAAQAAGGDVRGRQSAAIVIVPAKSTGKPWQDYVFNLRVDDSNEPLKDLRRLVTLQRAYNHMNAGDKAVELHDNPGALREYGAAEQLVPDNAEMVYWHAIALANMGRVDESLPLFKKVFAIDHNWVDLTSRLPAAGLLPDDKQLIQKIVNQAK